MMKKTKKLMIVLVFLMGLEVLNSLRKYLLCLTEEDLGM
jgi:hypothetical protein